MAEDITTRTRILALCGAKSNNEVTQLQLSNLNITEDNYDIVYLNGWKEVAEGDPELTSLVHGPFYSWIDEENKNLDNDLLVSVQYVLNAVSELGPFDGIYGFSQGALIASLVAGIADDEFLSQQLATADISAPRGRFSTFSKNVGGNRRSTRRKTRMSTRKTTRKSTRKTTTTRKSRFTLFGGAGLAASEEEMEAPFAFVVLACGAGYSALGNTSLTVLGGDDEDQNYLIKAKSIHIIGIDDSLKTESEGLASMYLDPSVVYHPGGHGIGREIKGHDGMMEQIREFVQTRGDPVQVPLSMKQIELSGEFLK